MICRRSCVYSLPISCQFLNLDLHFFGPGGFAFKLGLIILARGYCCSLPQRGRTDDSLTSLVHVHYRTFAMSAQGKYLTLAGALAFVGVMAVVPFAFTKQKASMITSERALTHSQIRRGQFMNSGSKDVGPDTNWDLKAMTYLPKTKDK